MKVIRNRPTPGGAYKIDSNSKSFLLRYGEDSQIWIEATAREQFGKCFMRKKNLVTKFYRDRLSEIPDTKGEVFYGSVSGTIDSSYCLVHESEIGDEI
jgi:hypothetical protein